MSLLVKLILLVGALGSGCLAQSEEEEPWIEHFEVFGHQLEQRFNHLEMGIDELKAAFRKANSNNNLETQIRELKEVIQSQNRNNNLELKISDLKATLEDENRNSQIEADIKELKKILDNVNGQLQNLTNGHPKSCGVENSVEPVKPTELSRETSELRNVTIKSLQVVVERNTFGHDWIVIQHRYDGSINFNRNWRDYRDGFGNFRGEFWLGLENIHMLTSAKQYELLVLLESFDGLTKFARYGKFAIGTEAEGYPLKTLESYSGTAGDALDFHKGSKFTTKDRDNDPWSAGNDAVHYKGAWWYNDGIRSNLNGMYLNAESSDSMFWFYFNYKLQGLKTCKMMIREV